MTMSIDRLQMVRRPSGLSRAFIGARLKPAIFNRHSTTAIVNPTPQIVNPTPQIDSLNPQIDNRQSQSANRQSQSTISTDNRQSQSESGSRQTGNHHSAVRNR
jgi:hypothetical protein